MNDNLRTAIMASIDGGKEILKIYKNDFEVEFKEDNSPLTIADENANAVINKYLLKTNIPIISEENKQIDFQQRKSWSKCWIVDPLDGTKEFVKRNGEFTVNIALVENGKPLFGVIFVPDQKVLYFGDVRAHKSFKATVDLDHINIEKILKEALEISPRNPNPKNKIIVGSRSHMNDETLSFVESFKKEGVNVDIVSKGSSLKFCLIAEGEADIYPRFAPTMEWDTAAGQAICEAVGLKVISQQTKETLLYNKENLLNPGFLVSK
ncbi:3'(2'),5'-bisphosphate nucleotidase CysQ [Namhaeicola litoreus]|uniref:3'(2'),5'-bisphosphate nucleotidase CysQ n=1 Tax=Namhaeicola litoreus TaxID=1052145 RepID=A0ABW3Y4M8_9FLAO